ncbi:MAG: response regulator [Lachnospiraceae bacterium]|nr:response regulator [Lachnospiraceae bacterium]
MYKVIVVEDEDIIRRGICLSVPWEEAGCHVIGEARNGEEGEALIRKEKPDIVITDINMPVMDGLQMIAETKCEFDYVAIILTGYSDFEYAREAIKNGVSDYVMKPLDMEEMKEALGRAVLEADKIRILRRQSEQTAELQKLTLLDGQERQGKDDPVVTEILDFVEQEYARKVTLADLVERLHYSERYLNQKFQKAMNTTIIEYLNRYRIQKALTLLRETDTPLSDIGWQCGVGDYKYFNHVFRKYVGCSPKEYRG